MGTGEKPSAEFGARVRSRRLQFGWSQTRLAQEAGFKQQTIVSIEAGERKHPEKVAHPLARALQTTAEWLLHGTGEGGGPPPVLTPGELLDRYMGADDSLRRKISDLASRREK